MWRLLNIFVLAVACWGSAHAQSFGVYDQAPTYTEALTSSQYVTMRDGVAIAVSITRPARNGRAVEGRFPVVWQAQLDILPAGAGPAMTEEQNSRFVFGPNALVAYGYVVANVARRGAGASFGVRRGYQDRTEAFDSYEINEWLAAQPWSSGVVGMVGCSNTGEAVMHTLTTAPPSLRAVFAGCFSWNRFDGFTNGGIIANWGAGPTRTIEQDMTSNPVEADVGRVLLRQAAEEHQQNTDLFALMRGMPYRDSFSTLTFSRFWGEGSVSSYLPQLRRSNVAVYVQGGWHDDFRREGLVAWANLPNQPRLVIGPWTHCTSAGINISAEMRRFFDYHLKGVDTGIARDPAIHYYTMNAPEGRAWRSTNVWPLPQTRMQRLFLAGGADARLSERAPSGRANTSFQVRYDVDCPREGPASAFWRPCHVDGAGPAFIGPVLTSDTEVTGHPLARLWIMSSAPDAHIFAFLEDVAPDGGVRVVTEGRLRASIRRVHEAPYNYLGLPWHRAYAEDAQPLRAGEPAELVFDMLPISYVFKAGHRIQVSITGADFRERGRNELSPSPTITVLNDPGHRSSVSVPIIPERAP